MQVFGEQKYAVRVHVDPNQLAAHNIGIDEVQKAIASSQHQPAHRAAGWRQAGLHHRIERRAVQGGAYRPIIVAYRNGSPVRLEQLGNVLDSVENNKVLALVERPSAR